MHTSRLLDARLHVTTGQPGAADGGLALYQLALAAVECALDAWLAPAVDAWAVGGDDDVVPDAPLRDAPVRAALACACDAARAHDVSIVRLLLVITYAWSRALRSRRRPGNAAPHLLAHLFALGIREYIAPAIPAPRATATGVRRARGRRTALGTRRRSH